MGFLDSFNPNSGDWVQYITDTLWWLGIVFWTILGVGVVVVFWYFITFSIPTHVYEIIGKEKTLRFIRKTRCKIGSKAGVTHLKVFGVKDNFPPPNSDDYQLGRKGKLLNLLKEGVEFKPFIMSANPGHITIQDMDVRFWVSQAMKEETNKYIEQSFFQKYGHYMAFIFGLLVLGWMYYILIQTVGADVSRNLAIGEKVAEALQGKVPGAP